MNKNDLAIFYEWGAKVIIFAIPLLFVFIDRASFFPYVAPRAFIFRFLTEIAFAFTVGGWFLKGKLKPKFSLISAAVLIFLAVIGAADYFGVNPYRSFWSRFERMDGYLNLIHLVLFFLAAGFAFKKRKDWFWFFNTTLFVSVIEFFYALLQKLGKIESIIGGFRAEGTFGNPTYLAAFALFAFGIALMLLTESSKSWQKIVFSSVALVNLITMYMSATRGVFVALFVGFIIFSGIIFFIKTEGKKIKILKKASLSGLLILLSLSALIWFFRDSSFVSENETLRRLTSISFSDRTTMGRFLVWEIALKGAREYPVLGWGQENFVDVFNKYYDPALYNQEMWFDRAHNVIMDWLVAGGVLGLLSYIFIFGAVGFVIFRVIKTEKDEEKKISGAILLVLFVSYFIQNIFVFDNMATYAMFFVLLAYADFLRREISGNSDAENFERKDRKNLSIIATSILVVCFLAVSWVINFKPYLQARAMIKSVETMYEKEKISGEVLDSFKNVFNYNTFGNGEMAEQMGKIINEIIITSKGNLIPEEDKKNFVKETIEEMKKQLERDPNNLRMRLFLGTIYTRLSDMDESYWELGNKELREALKISPKKQQIYIALVESYLKSGDFEKAYNIAEEAYKLDENYKVTRGTLAYVALVTGKSERVEELVSEGLNHDYLAKLGDVYIVLKDFKKAIEMFEGAIKEHPGLAEYRAKLAGLYLNQGKIKEAVEQAKMAESIDPENYTEGVKVFLENVKKLGYEVE
ncbi:MAG: O-antigen ligase family protein [Candidatus Pacebacteria bacterium]|nr:O-antigen ligase family protein [Candidatus Paceibacterota bacterium]